jgi:patatin-like phospholipase/acyl hydrolase
VVRFRSYPGRAVEETHATIVQAALATSAATSFFEPVTIGGRQYVDGALQANNPVNEMWSEAQDIWCPRDGALEKVLKCVISIGTGNPGMISLNDNALTFLTKTLVQIATKTVEPAKTFMEHHRGLLDSHKYLRLNVEQGLQEVGLDGYEERNKIETATLQYLDEMDRRFKIQDVAKSLGQKQCTYQEEVVDFA